MLIQGAGGNVSWKDGNVLRVKASGAWLAEANKQEIFVALDLTKTRQLIKTGKTDFISAKLDATTLRPSIETFLHAILPHPIVVHVHAVDIIASAVTKNARAYFSKKLNGLNWAWVDYAKPGQPLAKKISAVLSSATIPDVLILGNHGLVVAAKTIEEVNSLLQDIILRCKLQPRECDYPTTKTTAQLLAEWETTSYTLPSNFKNHSLGVDVLSLELARRCWVMYPDHAVFLGAKAIFYDNDSAPKIFLAKINIPPPCIIIPGRGLVVQTTLTANQNLMLNCYVDIVSRLTNCDDIITLTATQIDELLNWDAEKYRQNINSHTKKEDNTV